MSTRSCIVIFVHCAAVIAWLVLSTQIFRFRMKVKREHRRSEDRVSTDFRQLTRGIDLGLLVITFIPETISLC